MKKQFYLLLLCVFGFAIKANAYIFDIANNKKYETVNYSKEYTSDKPYFKKTIEIDYENINVKNDPKIDKLNSQTLAIGTRYIENEATYLSIIREANLRTETLNTIQNSKRNYRENNFQNPDLKEISIDIISIINNRVFYEATLLFESQESNGRDSEEIKVKEYYLGNLNDGSIIRWKPTIKDGAKRKIEDLIYKDFQQTYLALTNKLTAKEISQFEFLPQSENKENSTSNFASVFQKIDVSQADFFWYESGLIVQFQEYANKRSLYGGRFFNLFFSHDEALEIVRNIPEFSFVTSLPPTITSIKNWNSFDIFYKKQMEISAEPQAVDLVFKTQSGRKVKSLTQTNYQISTENKRFQGKTTTEFNAAQKVLSIQSYGENEKLYASTFNDYDANNKLLFVTQKDSYGKDSFISYSYDINNNLKKQMHYEREECSIHSYFYAKDFIYSSSARFFEKPYSEYYNQYQIHSDFYKISDLQYNLDQNQNIKGVVSDKNFQYQVEIGRDDKGRIKETHKENDRYNSYFEYDDLGRLISYASYEYTDERMKIIFSYTDSEMLPNKKSKTSHSGGNETVLEENYQWSFFE